MILPQDIIRKKRQGAALSAEEIGLFVDGLKTGTFNDAQVGAMAMSIFLQGMNVEETVNFTLKMKHSGDVMDWSGFLDGPIVDKHSTGGVGDKVSLMLAPMVAACGAYVPMIAGRGLGHSGGTIDKLETIPGYNTRPDVEHFRNTVKSLKTAVIAQTNQLAPSDKRLYAIRDITSTVESIPLITGSILSKKLAAGLEHLIMDVKVGSGAMMNNIDDAMKLAKSIVNVATGAGVPTEAVITDMNQVLGLTAGNSLEIMETVDYLTGKHREPRLHHVVMTLARRMLICTGIAANDDEADKKLNHALDSGAAAEIFDKMVVAMGGPSNFLENAETILPKATFIEPILAPCDGYINEVDTRAVGMMIVGIGGGRVNHEDRIIGEVGLSDIKPLGTKVSKGDPLALLHVDKLEKVQDAKESFLSALTIGDADLSTDTVIHDVVRFEG